MCLDNSSGHLFFFMSLKLIKVDHYWLFAYEGVIASYFTLNIFFPSSLLPSCYLLQQGWNSMETVISAERLALTLQSTGNLREAQELFERYTINLVNNKSDYQLAK